MACCCRQGCRRAGLPQLTQRRHATSLISGGSCAGNTRCMPVLSDRYELGPAVGNGGMGEVYEAYDQKLSRRVAVKCLKPGFTGSHHERFVREVRHAAAFIHPNVVTVFDVGEDEGSPYFVMELVDGHTLAAELKAKGPLPAQEAVRIAGRRARGSLRCARPRPRPSRRQACQRAPRDRRQRQARRLRHRQGRPRRGDGTDRRQRHHRHADLSLAGAGRRRPDGPATDLYAVGVLLYEMLAGAPPFRGDSPMATAIAHRDAPVPPLADKRPDVPNRLVRTIERALEKDPADRFADADEMRAALADAVPAPWAPPPSRPPSRRPRSSRAHGVLSGAGRCRPHRRRGRLDPAPPRCRPAPTAAPTRERRGRGLVPGARRARARRGARHGRRARVGGGGGAELGDTAQSREPSVAASQSTQPSTTVTTVPTPRSIAELFTVLASNPSAYGSRGPELYLRASTASSPAATRTATRRAR